MVTISTDLFHKSAGLYKRFLLNPVKDGVKFADLGNNVESVCINCIDIQYLVFDQYYKLIFEMTCGKCYHKKWSILRLSIQLCTLYLNIWLCTLHSDMHICVLTFGEPALEYTVVCVHCLLISVLYSVHSQLQCSACFLFCLSLYTLFSVKEYVF